MEQRHLKNYPPPLGWFNYPKVIAKNHALGISKPSSKGGISVSAPLSLLYSFFPVLVFPIHG
jgi:hypothetical protein